MPIEYHDRTEEEYRRRASVMIRNFEGFGSSPYDAGDNMATIGYGYTFNRSNNIELWDAAGVHLSQDERRQLAAIDAAPANRRTALGLAFTGRITQEEARSLLENVSLDRYQTHADRLGIPNSDERAATVSVTYNRGDGRMRSHMQGFNDAIADGDRAEAWYQLRYNSRGTNRDPDIELGIRARRNMEAHAFGLYNDPQNVTSDEARNVYRMFQLHREDILANERVWGVDFDGNRADRRHDAVGLSNRNWPDLSREYGQVPTISEALEPARRRLLADLRAENPDLADRLRDTDFASTAIFLDPGRELRDRDAVDRQYPTDTGNRRTNERNEALRAVTYNTTTDHAVDDNHAATLDSLRTTRGPNPREIDSNDLLIGMGGDDTLRAHRGDDILIGGAGRDRMEGGVGHDTYVVGGGDTIMDNDGRGELRWNRQALTGGARNEDDPANTYRSADGQYTYTLDGTTLTVAHRDGESVRVENYARGDLGIRLEEPAARREGEAPPENAPANGRNERPEQDTFAQSLERLNPQDRATYDRMLASVQSRGGYSEEQAQNIAAAGLAEFRRRDTLVRESQDVGIYGDRLFTAYFPHGRDREPNFHANVRLDDAAQTPARDSLQQVETLQQQRAIAPPTQQLEQREQQNGPTLGGRTQ
ncbi:MAG: calcium-binding protein [Lysobacter sp.]|nr:MAG: calcium-binding protein [Lysobacter sp.]